MLVQRGGDGAVRQARLLGDLEVGEDIAGGADVGVLHGCGAGVVSSCWRRGEMVGTNLDKVEQTARGTRCHINPSTRGMEETRARVKEVGDGVEEWTVS